MGKRQKRSRRKPFKYLISIGVFFLVLGFIVWSIYQFAPTFFPAWFDKVLLIIGGFAALLTVLSTAITLVEPVRDLAQSKKAIDTLGLADSKPIRRVNYETLTDRLGKSGKIPWIDRGVASPGLLRAHGRVAIVGWMKSGKTREAAEMIRMATEDGTIAAIYEPTSALDLIKQDSLAEAVAFRIDDRQRTLFFVDELGLRPEVEHLERLSQCLETITNLRRDTYCLITIQQERLTDTFKHWLKENDFHLLELGPLSVDQRQELVNTAKGILKFDITPEAINVLANQTDGRPYSIVFTLQQASRETELSKILVEKLLNQSDEEAWAEQRRNVISSEPLAEILLESIATFVSAGVTSRSSSIKQYACYLSGYKRQKQNFFKLLDKAAKRWATFDIVETEGLFTIPEPLVLPLLKESGEARVKLRTFINQYKSGWLNTCLLKFMEVSDGAFKTNAWKRISRKISRVSPPKKYWDIRRFVINSSTWERTFGQLIDQFFSWPVDRILLLAELGENTDRKNYLLFNALLGKGNSLMNEKHYEDAIDYFTKAIILSSNNARAYTYRGIAYRRLEKWNEAIKDQTKAYEIDSSYNWIIAQRGLTYRLMEKYDDSLKDFDRAIELDEKYTWAIAQRGFTYRQMERYELALQDFDRAIELDDKYTWAISQRGFTYRQMERYEDALKDFDRAIELDDKYTWAISQRGFTYRQMERYEDALKDFKRASELDDKYKHANFEAELVYSQIRQRDDALEIINRIIEVDSKDIQAIAERGIFSSRKENHQDALKDFRRAVSLDSDYAWEIFKRKINNLVSSKKEKREEILMLINCFIELDDENDWAIGKRGATYHQLERYEEALQDLNRAIELNDKNFEAIRERGATYRQLERYGEALQDFNRAIELNDRNAGVIEKRGLTYLQFKQYEKALQDFNRAIDINYKKARLFEKLGINENNIQLFLGDDWCFCLKALAHIKLNESEEALNILEQAISLATQKHEVDPDNSFHAFNLALYQLLNENTEEATQLYRTTLDTCTSIHDIKTAAIRLKDLLKVIPEHQDVLDILQLTKNKLETLKSESTASQ